jgi:hypothetical protein
MRGSEPTCQPDSTWRTTTDGSFSFAGGWAHVRQPPVLPVFLALALEASPVGRFLWRVSRLDLKPLPIRSRGGLGPRRGSGRSHAAQFRVLRHAGSHVREQRFSGHGCRVCRAAVAAITDHRGARRTPSPVLSPPGGGEAAGLPATARSQPATPASSTPRFGAAPSWRASPRHRGSSVASDLAQPGVISAMRLVPSGAQVVVLTRVRRAHGVAGPVRLSTRRADHQSPWHPDRSLTPSPIPLMARTPRPSSAAR